MELKLTKIGNSRGIRLPKSMLQATGITDRMKLEVRGEMLIITPVKTPQADAPRQGWAVAAQALSAAPDSEPRLLPDVFADEDAEELIDQPVLKPGSP